MNSAQEMRNLLEPLGTYRWEGSFQWAELCCLGAALDQCGRELEDIQREMSLSAAEEEGLEAICSLLAHRPMAQNPVALRKALTALLNIRDGSFSLQAVNDNLSGCGLVATAVELGEPDILRVHFPQVPGIPEDFSKIQKIIENIIPCHLEIEYWFWYITWTQLERKIASWAQLEGLGLSWKALETYVEQISEP